jgi:hypothetical protein
MFHRVVVDVVEMSVEIVFIVKRMFPIARLPNPSITSLLASGGHGLFNASLRQPFLCEFLLDPTPLFWIFRVARRK